MGAVSMRDCLIEKLRISRGAVALVIVAAVLLPKRAAAAQRLLADALPPGHPSCHALVLNATQRAEAGRRVTNIAVERTKGDVAAERKWGAREQFDDTPVVSATLRVRFRGDPVTHSARLACIAGDEGSLICMTPSCVGGELRIAGEGVGSLALSIGGKLKSGRVIRHYVHLDDSCEGRSGGPLVLEQEGDDRPFSLAPAPKEACR
jgi:hypothetical protein